MLNKISTKKTNSLEKVFKTLDNITYCPIDNISQTKHRDNDVFK